jgi:hypothetical protein
MNNEKPNNDITNLNNDLLELTIEEKKDEEDEEEKKIIILLKEVKENYNYGNIKLIADLARENSNRVYLNKNNAIQIILEVWADSLKNNNQNVQTMIIRVLSNLSYELPENIQKIIKYENINVPKVLIEFLSQKKSMELRRNTCVALINFCHADGNFLLNKFR